MQKDTQEDKQSNEQPIPDYALPKIGDEVYIKLSQDDDVFIEATFPWNGDMAMFYEFLLLFGQTEQDTYHITVNIRFMLNKENRIKLEYQTGCSCPPIPNVLKVLGKYAHI